MITNNINRDTLTELLQTLNTIIESNRRYKKVSNYIQHIKQQNGSQFIRVTPKGVESLILTLEDLTLPETETDKIEVNVFNELLNITHDFSFLSGVIVNDWKDIITYIYYSMDRAKNKEDRDYNENTNLGKHNRDLLQDYPWLLVILLIEQLPIINN